MWGEFLCQPFSDNITTSIFGQRENLELYMYRMLTLCMLCLWTQVLSSWHHRVARRITFDLQRLIVLGAFRRAGEESKQRCVYMVVDTPIGPPLIGNSLYGVLYTCLSNGVYLRATWQQEGWRDTWYTAYVSGRAAPRTPGWRAGPIWRRVTHCQHRLSKQSAFSFVKTLGTRHTRRVSSSSHSDRVTSPDSWPTTRPGSANHGRVPQSPTKTAVGSQYLSVLVPHQRQYSVR